MSVCDLPHHMSPSRRRRCGTIHFYNKRCVSALTSLGVVSSDSRSAAARTSQLVCATSRLVCAAAT